MEEFTKQSINCTRFLVGCFQNFINNDTLLTEKGVYIKLQMLMLERRHFFKILKNITYIMYLMIEWLYCNLINIYDWNEMGFDIIWFNCDFKTMRHVFDEKTSYSQTNKEIIFDALNPQPNFGNPYKNIREILLSFCWIQNKFINHWQMIKWKAIIC